MSKKLSIRQFIEAFNKGSFNFDSVDVQINAGWFDWFCKDSSLKNKTLKLGNKLKQIVGSTKINMDTMYVFFKNNCPMTGSLYDDFRICDMESDEVIFTITPKSGHKSHNGKGSVWGRENNFEKPLLEGTWTDIKKYFLE